MNSNFLKINKYAFKRRNNDEVQRKIFIYSHISKSNRPSISFLIHAFFYYNIEKNLLKKFIYAHEKQ